MQDFFSSSSQLIAFRVIFCFLFFRSCCIRTFLTYFLTYLRRDGVRPGPHGRVFVGLGVGY